MGVLNSNFYNWLYSKKYFDYEIKPIYLRNSPLCDIKDQELNRLVIDILAAKKADAAANTAELEEKIDRRVYELYGLTDAEIKIIKEGV